MFDKLYEECLWIQTKAEMQPEEETRKNVGEMIYKISEARVDEKITDEENDILVDMLN